MRNLKSYLSTLMLVLSAHAFADSDNKVRLINVASGPWGTLNLQQDSGKMDCVKVTGSSLIKPAQAATLTYASKDCKQGSIGYKLMDGKTGIYKGYMHLTISNNSQMNITRENSGLNKVEKCFPKEHGFDCIFHGIDQ